MARRSVAREDSGLRTLSQLAPAPPAPKAHPRREPRPLGVVAQVRVAFRRQNRLAAAIGAILGGTVPVASYQLAHSEVSRDAALWLQVPAWLVLGGLLYSAATVLRWGRLAFGSWIKSIGFAVLLEGVLLASRTPWLSVLALAILVGVNAVSTACRLASG